MSPRLYHALNVASYAHRNQTRKGGDLPYIAHPFGVMYLASKETDDEDVLIACLFHDILEDVPHEYPEEKMREEFGDRVTDIVLGVTKNDELADWKERSLAYLDHLEHKASDESVIVSCADKLYNALSTLEDYRRIGNEVWARFHAGRDDQLWFYRTFLSIAERRIPQLAMTRQLADVLNEFEK